MFATAVLGILGRRTSPKNKESESAGSATETPEDVTGWDPYFALQSAFKAEGYTAEQVRKIQDHLFSDKIATNLWPFTDHAKALAMSVSNVANNHAGEVAEAITRAGGDPSNYNSLTDDVQAQSSATLAPGLNIPSDAAGQSSLLETQSGCGVIEMPLSQMGNPCLNFRALERLTGQLSMQAGNVNVNSVALSRLATSVATNAAYIGALGSEVANLRSITAPTVALASRLGVQASTVASMSLAGSFVGPLLGVIALVYAAWPEEEVDPWLKVESRVAKMLSKMFDAKRRTKLGNRMRRYVAQFSRCSQSWVANNMVRWNGVSVPRWLVEEAKAASENGGEFNLAQPPQSRSFTVPRCMSQLEGHMSLERDEWYGTDTGSFSGLFMPFANMHTQILSLLADNQYDNTMNWGAALKVTSAEYGSYMLGHLLDAWEGHVCRGIRLRHSLKDGFNSWRYSFVALRAVYQPHAAEDCNTQCGGNSGWCDFCGGRNEGACCKHGDGGVCKNFDVPKTSGGSAYHACVHTDCIQSNTRYDGPELKKLPEDGPARTPEECRKLCLDVDGAVAFTSQAKKCVCFAAGTDNGQPKRYQEKGAFSGPTKCKASLSLSELEDTLQENVENVTRVPMEEVEPCEKSPVVANFEELEEKHPNWIQTCFKQAAGVTATEYNSFYQRFAKFTDTLVWKAGCGAQHEAEWAITTEGDGFSTVSKEFDGGSFASCRWNREEQHDENMWIFDETRARGWTGTSKVNMEEQKTVKMQFPMPAWLHDLKRTKECLRNTAAGLVENPSEGGQSTSVGTIMEPVASNSFNEYNQLLASV